MGEEIRAARGAADLTQEALASRLGTTRFRVIDWEADRSTPGAVYAERLQRVLGLSPEVFTRPDAGSPAARRFERLQTRLDAVEDAVAGIERHLAELLERLPPADEAQER